MRIRQLTWAGPAPHRRQALAPVGPTPLSARWLRAQFRRTDDGAGGRMQMLRRGVKFWVRCWLSRPALAVSTAAIRDQRLGRMADTRPELALRPLRSYLRAGLDPLRRALALREHFQWLASHLPGTTIERLYAGEAIGLAGPSGAGVEGLCITLSTASGLGREGELALHLEWRGERVMALAFSVVDACRVADAADPVHGHGARIVIGTLQGTRGAEAALHELSAAAQRLRPTALLVLAAQGLAAAWGLEAPLGVAAASHVYAGYRSRRRRVALDYDAVWRDAGATRSGRHYWALPARPVLRPDSEVESRRRAQHRRRNALREQLIDAVRTTAAALRG